MRRLSPGRQSTVLSVTIHGAVLGLLFLLTVHPPALAPRHLPGTAQGTVQLFAYQQLGAPPGIVSAKAPELKSNDSAKPEPQKSPLPKVKQLSRPATTTIQGSDNEGSLGDGDISIALVRFHPRPEPDLSTLSPGDGGDIILDALIDDAGRIAHLSVSRSLGLSIDQQVIATVQIWTFTPAMRNGSPIASEQEIVFHYQRNG
jgi:protein TonB